MIWISIIAFSYFFFICWMLLGWTRIQKFENKQLTVTEKLTLVIIARNEAHHIKKLFDAINNQSLDKNNFEVFFIDDHSDDATVTEAERWKGDNFTILQQEKSVTFLHKKQAIEKAISLAQNDTIVLTDADCWMHQNWLLHIAQYIEKYKPVALLAPVQFSDKPGFFQRFQQMEFASLMASTASFVGLQNPIMANGANIAFSKKAFYEVNGYKNDEVTSGDDIFLVHKFKKKYGKKAVQYLKEKEAIVYTDAQPNWHDFIQQRIRWTSKNKHYTDWTTLLVGLYIYSYNLFVLFSWIFVLIFPSKWFFLLPFLSKLLCDGIYFLVYFSFSKQLKLFRYYFPIQILNTLYVIGIVFLSAFSSYEWKGRKWKI